MYSLLLTYYRIYVYSTLGQRLRYLRCVLRNQTHKNSSEHCEVTESGQKKNSLSTRYPTGLKVFIRQQGLLFFGVSEAQKLLHKILFNTKSRRIYSFLDS